MVWLFIWQNLEGLKRAPPKNFFFSPHPLIGLDYYPFRRKQLNYGD